MQAGYTRVVVGHPRYPRYAYYGALRDERRQIMWQCSQAGCQPHVTAGLARQCAEAELSRRAADAERGE